MRLKARVLHNVGPTMFFGYHPEVGDLFHAHDFDLVADNADTAADLIWTLCNVDDASHLTSLRPDLGEYGVQVTAYRARMNRSLSVSDVIVFYDENGRWIATMAVESVGHKHYAQEPAFEDGSNDTTSSVARLAWEQLLATQN